MNDPYATHLPVLRMMAQHLTIRCVLEVGSGIYSTAEFLNPMVFAKLARLDSLESEPRWAAGIRERFQYDYRLSLKEVPIGSLCEIGVLDRYDLIFIDNGKKDFERISIITTVAQRRPTGIVVIHDFDHKSYRRAAQGFDHCRVCIDQKPYTAILWNGTRLDVERMLDEVHLD